MDYFGTNLDDFGHYAFNLDGDRMQKTWVKIDKLPFHPENLTTDLPKGEVVFYQGGGYTVVGFAGSCKDTRPGTKSIFWVKEILTREQMIQAIMRNACALKIINKLPFEVRW